MNILALHSSSGLYGSSKVLVIASAAWIKAGHNVTVILSEEGVLCDEFRAIGASVQIVRLGILRKKYYSISGFFNRLSVLTKAFFKLKKIIRKKNIDIVYSNTTAVIIGAIVAKATHKKHIWHIHEIIEKPRFLYNILAWMITKFSYKAIVVSKAVYDNWVKKVPAKKLVIIYNGFDYSAFTKTATNIKAELSIPESSLVIGTAGRIHYWKGQNYFLQIAGILHQKYPGIHFIIAGDVFEGYEYLYDELKDMTKIAGIETKVHFLGFRNDMAAIYHSMDIFVLPSLQPDPLPTVVLEAMASGLPVVATKQGGALEMVEENKTGIFIPINEPSTAASLMEELIQNKLLRTTMGQNAVTRVAHYFSLEAFNNAIVEII